MRDESVFNDNSTPSMGTIKSGIAPEDENRFTNAKCRPPEGRRVSSGKVARGQRKGFGGVLRVENDLSFRDQWGAVIAWKLWPSGEEAT